MITTLPGLLAPHVDGDRAALLLGERAVGYAELDSLSRRAAAWLAAKGVRPGDRVAVWLVNRVEWLALLFGLARLGAALVAVNTRFRAAELEHILSRSGARLLIVQPGFRGIDFAGVLAEIDSRVLKSVEVVEIETVRWPDEEAPDRSSPDAPAAMFTTSGTTSGPKLVVHTQRTVSFHAQQVAQAYGFDRPGAMLLAALPFCGVFGFDSALGALAAGAPLAMMETFDAAAASRLLQRHPVTHVFGSDEMFRRLLELSPHDPPYPGVRMMGFATFQAGGAQLAETAWKRGAPMIGLYGSSEVHALFAAQRGSAPLAERIEAGGYPASAASQVRVRDVESGELLPPGKSGELEFRSPGNFAGYWNDPAATAKALGEDGFFRSGDLGRLREDGSFVFEARRGDAIRLAGYLVSPLEIEDAIKRVEGVADVQVVAIEIEGKPRAVAFVVGRGPSEQAIIAAASKRLAAFKVPARVWFVDAFPVTQSANGVKVQRTKLREMALARIQAS